VILDGEIVALDEQGRSSFQLLQIYKSSEQRVPLVYYVFDLLFLDGKDLRHEPLSARRKLATKRATYRRSLNLNRQTWPPRTMHSS
jgi:ATP-dependent DNA ligase